MKKYKLLKDLPKLNAGAVFEYKSCNRRYCCDSTDNTEYGYCSVDMAVLTDWFEEIKEEKKGRCLTEPEECEMVHIVGLGPTITLACYGQIYHGHYLMGLCFWDKESCEKEMKRMQVMQRLRVLAGGFEPDWNDGGQYKYGFYYSYINADGGWERFAVNKYSDYGQIYFETAEARDNAIKTLGKELDILRV